MYFIINIIIKSLIYYYKTKENTANICVKY